MDAGEPARSTIAAKAFAVWLLLMTTAIANGLVRERLLVPRLGTGTAHDASTALLCLLVFAITLATIGWIAPRSAAGAIAVGTLWLVLVLLFEFGFGHFVAGRTWSELFADYDLTRGRVWLAVPLVTWMAPFLTTRLRAGSGAPSAAAREQERRGNHGI